MKLTITGTPQQLAKYLQALPPGNEYTATVENTSDGKPKRKVFLKPEQRKQVKKLYKQGWLATDLAKDFNISTGTVYAIVNSE